MEAANDVEIKRSSVLALTLVILVGGGGLLVSLGRSLKRFSFLGGRFDNRFGWVGVDMCRYLNGLQAKLASYEKQLSQSASPEETTIQVEGLETCKLSWS